MTKQQTPDDTTQTAVKKKRSLLPLIALNIALFAGVLLVLFINYGAISLDQPPEHLPAFGMESLEGESFGSADLQGDVMIVNIFASWCTPCLAEHPLLMEISESENIPIYGIAMHDKPEDLRPYLARHGNPFRGIGMDYAGLVPRALNQNGLPITMILDKDLKIHWMWLGPITPDIWKKQMQPKIDALVAL